MLKIKRNIKKIYNTPHIVKFCKICVVSNQRPRISFNKDGICNACVNIKNKNCEHITFVSLNHNDVK